MMNDSTRAVARPRLAWSRTARTAAAIAAMAVAAACGGPSSAGTASSPHAASSPSSASGVAYSRCMRAHGVPNFPDPDSGGGIPKADPQQLGVSTTQLQAAQNACQSALPEASGSIEQQTEQCIATGNCPAALVQQVLALQRAFAQCMRSHGVARYPDPTIDSQGRPIFVISISVDGFDPHSPQIMTTEDQCQRVAPAPEPRQVNP